jgi:hypothetical protein
LTETKAESAEDLPASSSSSSSTGKGKPVDFFPAIPSPAPFTPAKPARKASIMKQDKKSKTPKTTNIFDVLSSKDAFDSKALDGDSAGVEEQGAEDPETLLPQKKNKKRGKKGGKAVQQKARREAQAAADAAFNKGVLSAVAIFILAVLLAGFGAFLKS